ncbi:MAG: AAA family ATPase [Chthoniobacterales bacterium]|nr:AAA family ATPase [Chthoniobacterales bacterium]
MQATNNAVQQASRWVRPLQQEIGRVIVGQKYLVDRLMIGLISSGHILLEGVPGLAKTLSLRTLAAATQAQFQRIQFKPDMLPADVVGTLIYNPSDRTFQIFWLFEPVALSAQRVAAAARGALERQTRINHGRRRERAAEWRSGRRARGFRDGRPRPLFTRGAVANRSAQLEQAGRRGTEATENMRGWNLRCGTRVIATLIVSCVFFVATGGGRGHV